MARDSNRTEEFDTVIRTLTFLILFILPPILLITGCWNLYLASELGNRDGNSLSDMYQHWRDGLDITRQYSHSFLMGMKRISNAVMQISSALMMLCGAAALFFTRRKNR
jgi:hypothetical protein